TRYVDPRDLHSFPTRRSSDLYSSQLRAFFLIIYIKPNKSNPIKTNISIRPFIPNSLKLTAQGYINITSISKITNKIATIKYFIENGWRAFPTTSIPDSKEDNLFSVRTFGPIKCVTTIVGTPKPAATII